MLPLCGESEKGKVTCKRLYNDLMHIRKTKTFLIIYPLFWILVPATFIGQPGLVGGVSAHGSKGWT